MGSKFGATVRRLREQADLSQEELAGLAGISRAWLARIETGRIVSPKLSMIEKVAGALAMRLPEVTIIDLIQDVRMISAASPGQATILGPVERRTFLHRASAGALAILAGQLEQERFIGPLDRRPVIDPQLLTEAIGVTAASETSMVDWEETVLAHGRSTRDRPPPLMLTDLSADLALLNQAINDCRSSERKRHLARVIAQMSGLMCLTYVKLDDRTSFRRWARTARLVAREAGDLLTLSWVRAQEAYGYYYSDDLPNAIVVAQDAQHQAGGLPCVGAALAAALEARAQAALGRDVETHAALDRAEGMVSRLPAEDHEPSAFSYNEAQLRFHQSSALTQLGDTRKAWEAQDLALMLAAPYDYTDRALTSLDRAMCLAHDGDFMEAAAHACSTMTGLTEGQRCGIITLRARRLLAALPAAARTLPPAQDLRELTVARQGPVV